MRKTVYGLLAGTAAISLAACQPAETSDTEEPMASEETPAPEAPVTEEVVDANGNPIPMRDENGNPIGPGAPAEMAEEVGTPE